MFDPTVFENLKVAFENQLYDLDNLEGKIRITGRKDRLDMAVLSRELALQFKLAGNESVTAEIALEASLADLSAEILETPGGAPACTLLVRFYKAVRDVQTECGQIETVLRAIWKPELPPVQTVSMTYGVEPAVWQNTIELRFNRRINEEQMADIPPLVAYVVQTLERLAAL